MPTLSYYFHKNLKKNNNEKDRSFLIKINFALVFEKLKHKRQKPASPRTRQAIKKGNEKITQDIVVVNW